MILLPFDLCPEPFVLCGLWSGCQGYSWWLGGALVVMEVGMDLVLATDRHSEFGSESNRW